MLNTIEKFLFQQFPKMPQPVRVLTYLVMLVLFCYLLLIPKFIDGHVKFLIPDSGKMKDYKGALLRMTIEGRTYKFCANEDGYWSIPVVSKLPGSVLFEIYDREKDDWHKVKLSFLQVWTKGPYELELIDKPPYVNIVSDDSCKLFSTAICGITDVLNFLMLFPSQAIAGFLSLPPNIGSSLTPREKKEIQDEVFEIVARDTKKKVNEISLTSVFLGQGAPTYKEKIVIISDIEDKFHMAIPDEHWQSFETVGQIVDYVEKRIIVQRSDPSSIRSNRQDWQDIRKSFPEGNRPSFKY